MKIEKVEKLEANLDDKKQYEIHMKNLKFQVDEQCSFWKTQGKYEIT